MLATNCFAHHESLRDEFVAAMDLTASVGRRILKLLQVLFIIRSAV